MSIVGKMLKRTMLLKAEDLLNALRAIPAGLRPAVPAIPIVIAPKGVEWSLERKP